MEFPGSVHGMHGVVFLSMEPINYGVLSPEKPRLSRSYKPGAASHGLVVIRRLRSR